MEIPVSEIREYLLPSSNEITLKNEGVDENFDECICFDCSKEPIVSLKCGHKYHKKCISEWIKTCETIGPTCPKCRRLMIRDDYEFWFKLGRETCNMAKWSCYCYFIISRNFGKSSPFATKFPTWSAFLGVQADLDSLIQQSYDRCEDDEFNKHLRVYLNIPENKRINCCDVFYNIDNIVDPQIPYPTSNRYNKTITLQQKHYIDEFRNRLKLFLNYLDYITDNMTIPKNTLKWEETTRRHSMKEFNKSVDKLRKWNDKLVILDELNLS
jgi:hypothetical protein